MRKSALIVTALLVATSAGAQITPGTYELPKLTQPPTLDGNRFTVPGEWTGALEQECSSSQILRDGAQYGWRDLQLQVSEVSANQLNQSEGEDAAIARSDNDALATLWQAWDDDAFYYVAEVRDNVRDVTSGERLESWWERDSISLYLDLNNENTGNDATGTYVNLNIVNFVAAPQNSSPVTVTLETTVQQARQATQDPDATEGFTYAFRDAGDEFGGEADYAIEGKMEWDAFLRVNLNSKPTVGTTMGYSWILLDPDNDGGYGGQLVCWGFAAEMASYADYLFSSTKAGPGAGTPVEADSWGRVKATFAQ